MNKITQVITQVITHAGSIHLDEVMAIAILNQYYPVGLGGVLRHDPTQEELDDPTIACIDVGGRYEPELMNFDHHQNDCPRRPDGGKASAVGLVWRYAMSTNTVLSPVVKERIDQRIIHPIERMDTGDVNGVRSNMSLGIEDFIEDINSCILSSGSDPEYIFIQFKILVGLCEKIYNTGVHASSLWAGQRDDVLNAHVVDRTLVLDRMIHWMDHIYDHPKSDLLYVVYPSNRGGWCIQQISVTPDSFEGRKSLPEAWAGLRGKELAEVLGFSISDSPNLFCHNGRFIAGADTKEEVLLMAEAATNA